MIFGITQCSASVCSYSGAQRFVDPYTRSYLPYPPGPNYPYYPQSQSMVQRSRVPQPSGLEYANINTCNQPRPPLQSTPGGGTPNQVERPPSRSINYLNSPTHAAFSNTQVSSPVHSSGSQPSSWSPHSASYGSSAHMQSQPRPRSLSKDFQVKMNEVQSESPNANNSNTNSATRPDNQSEGIPNNFEDTSCRPQSRLSDTGTSAAKGGTLGVKDQSDIQITTSLVETTGQNPSADGISHPQVSTPSSSIANLSSVSPLSSVSHEASSAQNFPSFVQAPASSSSPMTTQITNIQSQPATCASPGQTKGPYQSCQTVPSPRPQGVSNQEMGILRMGYPSYSHPQAPLPNNPYSSGGRTPGFPSAGYSLRPPSMHAAVSLSDSIPYRQQFQTQSSSGPASTSSMPPPPTLPPASVSSSQSCAGDNNGPSQPPFSQVLPYSTPVSSTSSGYATPGSVHGPHLPWDQEASYQPTPHHPSNMFHHQFGGRPPYIGPPDRGSGYLPSSSVPSSNASNSVPHNGQHLHPSATGPYPHNQSLSSYAIHHAQYPYSQSQMPYHSQSQYTHPYSPGPGAPVIQQQQQHMAASTGAMASTYSSPMLNNASPLPHHLLNSRDGFHMHYPHDVQQHPSVSSSNENFTPASFPQNGGSPGNIRPSSVINSVSKPVVAGGKMTKSELLTRPVNSTISASSQISTNQTGLGPTEVNSMNFPQQYQHRVPGQSSHPQMLQQYPGNYPSGIGSHRFGAPSGGGEILQGSSTFQSFQQQYHSIPNSHVPPEPQNTSGPIDNQSSLYSSDETHSDVGNLNQTLNNLSSQSLTGFHKLLEMGNEPERRPWLENYMRFMDDIGKPVVGIPQVVKQPLDLYRFYVAVRERGGVAEVIKARRWKEVSQAIGINASASAAYGLRKNYCKFLLEYECRFDRDGSDPRPLLTHIENLSGKKRKCSSVDSDPNSLSNDLPPPAPPSPTGSHSSASSSLLPPGSSGASLSGGPSGTAGSAASDSQLGPPSSQQHRFSDHGQPGSVSTVPESPNGIPNVPSPPGLSGQSSNSYLPSSGPATMNVPSPQRPLSCTVANGYSNVPISASDSNCCPWPWTPENSNSESGTHQTPAASESSTMEHSGILVTREATSSQYAQSRIPSGSISFNSNVLPSNVYAGGPNPNCASSAPSGNTEPMAQHNFNPYLPQNPVFVSNPSHPVLSQHHGPPQLMDHPFTGSQSPIHPRHPTNHSFRTPSFNTATPPNAVSSDSVAMFRMHQLRSGAPPMSPYMSVGAVTPYSAHNNNNNNNSNLSQNSPLPPHLTQHGNQRPGYVATILKRLDHYTFPPGSVEATPIDSPRRRRYRAKDLGR
ncbi:unnamed protein product [Trichobilharzia regenti]|nr:unnamed protein product [Trichobilharzia regenti]